MVGPNAPAERRSLATRNFHRSLAFALPAGQTVARFMGEPEFTENELWDGVADGRRPAPLWYYILREAEVRTGGRHLAGVGATIVAEVFIGMLEGDKASYVHQWPNWRPELGPTFGMVELLRFAGLFPAT